MSTHNKTYQPLQLLTVTAGEDLPACRFVNYSGSLCDEDTMAFGVTEIDWLDGELASVVTLGTVVVETSEAKANFIKVYYLITLKNSSAIWEVWAER